MAFRFKSLRRFVAGSALVALPANSQVTAGEPVVPDFWFPEPAPVLAAAAEAAGIALSGQESAPERVGLAQGDRVTFLVELVAGMKRRQWIVVLVGSELSEKDRALPSLPEMRLFTASGNELNFAGSRAALAIQVLGPVAVDDDSPPTRGQASPQPVWSGALVNGDFLRLGFARAEATMLRLHAAQSAREGEDAVSFKLAARDKPFSEETLIEGRATAAALGITRDDELAIFATAPALREFFNVASRTPGVNGIVQSVIDIPVWSILLRGGRRPDVNINNLGSARLDSASWGYAAATEVFGRAFLLELNRHPALCCRMVVVEPYPPLVASAGVVGLAAGRPDGKGPRLMIWLIASRLASLPAHDAANGKN